MKLSLKSGSIAEIQTPLAIVGVFAGEALPPVVASLIEVDDFKGGFKKTLLVTHDGTLLA